MPELKNKNRAKFSFLIGLAINAVIFAVNWEYVVQAKSSSPLTYVLFFGLYILGVAAFYVSFSDSKRPEDKTWHVLSLIGLVATLLWMIFSLFAVVFGVLILSKAFNQIQW